MNYRDFYSYLGERYGGAAKERGIWYHGTSAERARKILITGLNPDIPKKERSWDKDEPSAHSPTRESYGGIYVSRNFMTAYSSAGRTARRDGTPRAVIIMELQPRSLVSDEDDFASRLSSIAGHLHGSVYHHIYNYMWEVYGTASERQAEYAKKAKEDWCQEKLRDIFYGTENIDERLKKRVYDILYNKAYRAMLTRVVSYLEKQGGYSDKYEWVKAYRDAIGEWDKPEEEINAPKPPSPQEGERQYMVAIDQLTRTMKHNIRPSFTGKHYGTSTARALDPIGFSGKNRIICILEFPISKSTKYSEDIHVVYGKVPGQFVEDWEKSIGDARFV
jgi:hypothetical protein